MATGCIKYVSAHEKRHNECLTQIAYIKFSLTQGKNIGALTTLESCIS